MPVKILCPNPDCNASYSVLDEDAGGQERCKVCGTRFPVAPGTRAEAPPSSSDPDFSPKSADSGLPESFGRYRVVGTLGRGGMGAVYLAHDTQLDRQVAVKVPHIHAFGDSPEVRQRFFREAKAAARFQHPNFCPIFDIGEAAGVPFLTMAFIEGKTLAASIERGTGWPPRRAVEVARDLATALGEAHRRGIIHRDLKPANVMVNLQGGLVLMDFGLARWHDEGDATFTPTGAVLGTPSYMPPEQAEGNLKAIGPRSDLYSLGVILYELLTGRRPFEGSITKVLGMIAFAEPPPPSTHRPDLDPRLEAICLKAMAKKPDDRFGSMDEFTGALQGWLDAPPSPGPALPEAARPEAIPQEVPSDRDVSHRVGLALPRPESRQGEPYPTGDRQGTSRARRLAVALTVAAIGCGAAFWALWTPVPGGGGEPLALKVAAGPPEVVEPDRISKRPPPPRTEALAPAEVVPPDPPPKLEPTSAEVGKPPEKAEESPKSVAPDPPPQPEPASAKVGEPPEKVEEPPRSKAADPPTPAPKSLADKPPPPVDTEKPSEKEEPKSIALAPEPVASRSKVIAEVVPPAIKPKSIETITNSVGMALHLIPAGEFLMGSGDSDKEAQDDEKPQHRVRITRPFYLGTTEVTQGQYRAVTGQDPSGFKGSDDLPVEQVSWNDAVAFCNKVSEKEGLKLYYQFGAGAKSGGDGYRLPTEAEWEYACRAGSTTRYQIGDDTDSLGEYTWFSGNSGNKTHPVGQKRPNAFGLFDMHGNVSEWCWDWDAKDYYVKSPVNDPQGASQSPARVYSGGGWGSARVTRGGSWGSYQPGGARSAVRFGLAPDRRDNSVGFRVARVRSVR